MRGAIRACLVVALVGHHARAQAPTPALATPTPGPTRPAASARQWYGPGILVGDGLTFAVTFGSLGNGPNFVSVFPYTWGAFVLHAPVQHVAHRQYGKAGLSLLVRAGFPLLAAGIASSSCETESAEDCFVVALTGMLVGAVGASALDVGVLAYEPAPQRFGSTDLRLQPRPSLGRRQRQILTNGTTVATCCACNCGGLA